MFRYKEFLLSEQHNFEFSSHSHEGMIHYAEILEELKNLLVGKKTALKLTTDYGNGLNVDFGVDKQKQLFVKYKNKTYYSVDGVGKGQKAFLIKKLIHVLPKIIPKGKEIYNGNIIDWNDLQTQYSSGTILVDKESDHGRQIANSMITLFINGRYQTNGKIKPMDKDEFIDSEDVHVVNTLHQNIDSTLFTPALQRDYADHITKAEIAYRKIDPETFENTINHEKTMDNFVQLYSDDKAPKYSEYINYLKEKYESEINNSVMGKQEKLTRELDSLLDNVDHLQFKYMLELKFHVDKAKSILRFISNKHNESLRSSKSKTYINYKDKKVTL